MGPWPARWSGAGTVDEVARPRTDEAAGKPGGLIDALRCGAEAPHREIGYPTCHSVKRSWVAIWFSAHQLLSIQTSVSLCSSEWASTSCWTSS